MYDDYERLSEIKVYIKSLFKEISVINTQLDSSLEEVYERILYLLELYINQEVDLYIKKAMPEIVQKVLVELKKEIKAKKEENNGKSNI